jgi:hypothetical protein
VPGLDYPCFFSFFFHSFSFFFFFLLFNYGTKENEQCSFVVVLGLLNKLSKNGEIWKEIDMTKKISPI